RGRGFDFDQHKPYQQGDDYRQIDWNATARMPQPYIKKAYEEKEMNAVILADLSRSMEFATADQSKRQLLLEVTATLAFSAIKDDMKVGLLVLRTRLKSICLRKRAWRRCGRSWKLCGTSGPVHTGRTCFDLWNTWILACRPRACCFVFRTSSLRKMYWLRIPCKDSRASTTLSP